MQGEQPLQCEDSGQTESDCSVQELSVSLSPNERDSLQSYHDNAECTVYICDFHRLQAWQRWLSTSSHGLVQGKEDVLALLIKLAKASTESSYEKALHSLHESQYWKNNSDLRNWFERKWLCEKKRWVWAYRKDRFNVAINTNNGIERQNRSFKYDFLSKHRDTSLSGMLSVLVTQFLPSSFRRYLALNQRYSGEFKQYNQALPQWLHNRPRPFVDHVRMRLDSCLTVPKTAIQLLSKGPPTFTIKSDNEKSPYKVCLGDDNNMPFCSCPDWAQHHLPCKHMCAIFHHNCAFEYSWDSLSPLYRLSPYFCLDNEESDMGNDIPLSQFPDNEIDTEDEVEENEPDNITADTVKETKRNTSCLNVKKKALQCRELLAQLRDLTYLCEREDALEDLKASLTASLVKFRPQVPSENGLLLEKNTQRNLKTNKRVLTAVKYADLPPRKKFKKDNTANKENRKRKANRQQGTPQASCLDVPALKVRLPQSNSTHLPKPSQSTLSKMKHSTPASMPSRSVSPSPQPQKAQTKTTDSTPASMPSTSVSPRLPSQKAQTKTTDSTPASMPSSFVSPTPQPQKAQTKTTDSTPASMSSSFVSPTPQPQKAQTKTTDSTPASMSSTSVSPTLPSQTAATKRKDITPAASMPSPSLSTTSQKHPTLNNPSHSGVSSSPSLLHQSTSKGQPSIVEKKFVPLKVVHGSMSQQNKKFSDRNRGKQCTSNSLTFLLHHLTSPGDKKTKATIDAVLSAGDQLHTALTNALKCLGERLSFEDVSKAVKLLGEGNSVLFPQGILNGDIFSLSSSPPFLPLKVALQNALLNNSGTLLRFLEFTVAVCKLPDGSYNLFDPHARNRKGFVDGNSSAVIMSFPTLDSLVNHVRTFVRQNGLETAIQNSVDSLSMADRSFELLPVVTSNQNYGQPQNSSCLSRMINGAPSEQKTAISFQKKRNQQACRKRLQGLNAGQPADQKSIKCDAKEAEVVQKTLLNKFNMTLTNEDFNRLQDGEELNDQELFEA